MSVPSWKLKNLSATPLVEWFTAGRRLYWPSGATDDDVMVVGSMAEIVHSLHVSTCSPARRLCSMCVHQEFVLSSHDSRPAPSLYSTQTTRCLAVAALSGHLPRFLSNGQGCTWHHNHATRWVDHQICKHTMHEHANTYSMYMRLRMSGHYSLRLHASNTSRLWKFALKIANRGTGALRPHEKG